MAANQFFFFGKFWKRFELLALSAKFEFSF